MLELLDILGDRIEHALHVGEARLEIIDDFLAWLLASFQNCHSPDGTMISALG